jgi:cohesin loading factor subunit SCC2
MPKTAAKFGHELQAALQPMIIKPSGSGGVQVCLVFVLFPSAGAHRAFVKILQETVGCMCVVVQYLTHDFVRLVNLLKSCNGRSPILMF